MHWWYLILYQNLQNLAICGYQTANYDLEINHISRGVI